MNKYDCSDLFRKVRAERRQAFYERFIRTLWAIYPMGCLISLIIVALGFSVMFGYAVLMWLSSPSLNGTY